LSLVSCMIYNGFPKQVYKTLPNYLIITVVFPTGEYEDVCNRGIKTGDDGTYASMASTPGMLCPSPKGRRLTTYIYPLLLQYYRQRKVRCSICQIVCKQVSFCFYVISKRILPSLSFEDNASIASFTLLSLNFFHTLTLSSLLAARSMTSCNSLLVPPVEPINFTCLV
jgi:hypothetical protein